MSEKNNSIAEDEIDLGALLLALWDKKLWLLLGIVCGVICAIVYLHFTPKIYQADALISIEKQSGGISAALLGDMGDMLGSANSEADKQIAIIESRAILGQTVDQFHLQSQLARRIGFANFWHAPNPVPRSKINFYLDVPKDFQEKPHKLVLRFLSDKRIELLDDGEVLLAGQQNEQIASKGYRLFFQYRGDTPLDNKVMNVRVVNRNIAIDSLRKKLSVNSIAKDGGLLKLQLTDTDPQYARELLSSITQNYMVRNAHQSVEKLAQGADFIEKQLPKLRVKLEKAEQELSDYQMHHATVDLGSESETLIKNLSGIEGMLTELSIKQQGLRNRYTSNHPEIKAIEQQRTVLLKRRKEIEKLLTKVPESAQGLVRLKRNVQVNQTIYLQLLSKLQELNVAKASTTSDVQIIDAAQSSISPIKPKSGLILLAFPLAGFMLSSLIILLLTILRSRIQTIEDVTDNTGLEVIATIPESKKEKLHEKRLKSSSIFTDEESILSFADPDEIAVEALRSLRTNLYFGFKESSSNTLLITGPTEDVGKSFISTNLAVLMAQAGHKVALIDGDLRKSYLCRQFALQEDKLGIESYLKDSDCEIEQCIHQTKISDLDFVPCIEKTSNPTELILSARFVTLIEFMKKNYNVIIIDTPPALPVSDSLQMSKYVDSMLLVVRYDRTTVWELKVAQERLSKSATKFSGVVINQIVKKAGANKYYAYHYKY